MTIKRAIEVLDSACFAGCSLDESVQIREMAINAIKKTIPLMPILACPNCGKEIEEMDAKVCSTCGQALDWSLYDE